MRRNIARAAVAVLAVAGYLATGSPALVAGSGAALPEHSAAAANTRSANTGNAKLRMAAPMPVAMLRAAEHGIDWFVVCLKLCVSSPVSDA